MVDGPTKLAALTESKLARRSIHLVRSMIRSLVVIV